jgi:hypothetical protein
MEKSRSGKMEIFIKLSPPAFDRLRRHIDADSAARESIERASRIDHSVEGVLFAGYSIPCDDEQARIILETARQHFPEILPDIEKAMALGRSTR